MKEFCWGCCDFCKMKLGLKLAILHLFCQSLSIVLVCGGELLNVTFSFLSVTCIRWPGFVLIRVSRCVIDLMLLGWELLYKVNLNSNHCLFSEIPSASARVLVLSKAEKIIMYVVAVCAREFSHSLPLSSHSIRKGDYKRRGLLCYNILEMVNSEGGHIHAYIVPFYFYALAYFLFSIRCASSWPFVLYHNVPAQVEQTILEILFSSFQLFACFIFYI